MRFAKLTATTDGQPVYINPNLVVTASKYGATVNIVTATRSANGAPWIVIVKEPLEVVITELENAAAGR